MGIDEIDKRIINALLDDSRLSFRQIAKLSGVSVATALKRVRVLEKSGVLKGYTATVDYEQLGYEFEVLINIKVAHGKLFEVEKKIASLPNVSHVFDVTGTSDVVVLAQFKSRRELDNFLKKIQTFDFILKTNTILILNKIKDRDIRV